MRDLQVKTLLSVEEFLAFRNVCDETGVSMSSRIRMLIKEDVRKFADESLFSMTEHGQDRDH